MSGKCRAAIEANPNAPAPSVQEFDKNLINVEDLVEKAIEGGGLFYIDAEAFGRDIMFSEAFEIDGYYFWNH